jgi:peptidoglycan/xylan/chitin deacetylase (PgdA/CDA1 family)
MKKPIFVFSLDLELGWGFIFNQKDRALNFLKKDPKKTREKIKNLIKLLEKYEVPATWGVVGHLFLDLEKRDELLNKNLPQFQEGWLNWEDYSKLEPFDLYFGRDIIETILGSPINHEIGLQGFFHIPFTQCDRRVAEAEIKLGKEAARRFNINPKTFIFPKNMIDKIDILRENGFRIYRGKTYGHLEGSENFFIQKINALISRVIILPVSVLNRNGVFEIAGSMEFYDRRIPVSLVKRAEFGLNFAIATNRIFHLWVHPWSFVVCENLENYLENFFKFLNRKREKGKIEVKRIIDLISENDHD